MNIFSRYFQNRRELANYLAQVTDAARKREDAIVNIKIKEYDHVLNEIGEYTKLMLQTISIFLTFSPLVIRFALDQMPWIFFIFQAIIIFFLLYELGLDRDIFIDSAYAIRIERQVNRRLGETVLEWQQIIGYLDFENDQHKRFSHNVGPIILTVVFGIFYGFVISQGAKLIQYYIVANNYLVFSSILYLVLAWLTIRSRNKAVENILQKLREDVQPEQEQPAEE
jgi:hypothetical protein